MGSGIKKRGLKPGKPFRITQLKMSTGRVVTDPDEVRRLLIADGFTVDDEGRVGVGPKLRTQ